MVHLSTSFLLPWSLSYLRQLSSVSPKPRWRLETPKEWSVRLVAQNTSALMATSLFVCFLVFFICLFVCLFFGSLVSLFFLSEKRLKVFQVNRLLTPLSLRFCASES